MLTKITHENYYVLLTAKLYNTKLNHLYERSIVYKKSMPRDQILNILSISMNNLPIISIKEEPVLCLVNDSQDSDYFNRIDKYWIDGTLYAMTITKNNSQYKYMYIITELDTLKSSKKSDYYVNLNSSQKLYLESLKDCWILKSKYYDY